MSAAPPSSPPAFDAVRAEEDAMVRALVASAWRKSLLAGFVILALGAVAGGAGTYAWLLGHDRLQSPEIMDAGPENDANAVNAALPRDENHAKRIAEGVRHMTDRIAREFKPAPEAREEIAALLADHFRAMDALRTQTRNAMAPYDEKLRESVAALLPDDQVDRWKAQFHTRFFSGPGGPRRPHGPRPERPDDGKKREGRPNREGRPPFDGPRPDPSGPDARPPLPPPPPPEPAP